MECPRAYMTLVVLTVLELCRAGHIPPRWESAKLNDGFEESSHSNPESYVPQPSFPATRSSYPTSKQSFSSYSSTLPTHTSTVYSTSLPSSSTPVPQLYKQQQQRHVKIETIPQNIPYPFVQTFTPSDQPLLGIEPHLRLISENPHRNNLHNQHIEPPYSASLPVQNLFQPQTQTTLQPIVVTSPSDVSDDGYVVVYQPSSQTDDFSQTPFSKVAIRETSPGTFSTVPVTRTSELSTTQPTSFSTSSVPTTLLSSTTPFIASTTRATTKRLTVTPSSTSAVTIKPKTIVTNSTANSFRIRVLAPSGTITNVHINGVKQKTTKKPKTKRTSRPKKNTYERCLNRCKKVKDQICGAPLGHYSVSARDLKSFDSVCHMACYNSFKKDAFEKIESGHCDKLRKKLGKSNVIVREELKKAYAIAAKQSDTVIQLSKGVLEEK